MRAKLQGDNVLVNLVQNEMIMNLCDSFAMNNTYKRKQVMILNPGAPLSLAGRPWLDQYLKEFDLTIKDIMS